jgi:hypothetical protein
MALVHEELSRQFHDWEIRGRGWDVYEEPVRPEPPFRPFAGHFLKDAPIIDDGRRPTILSSLLSKFATAIQKQSTPDPEPSDEEEPEPDVFEHSDLIELRTTLPAKLNITRDACAEFLKNLSFCQCPIAFEIIGTRKEVSLQFACDRGDSSVLRRQLEAHFPDGTFVESANALKDSWHESPFEEALIAEFGLAREFMFRLRTDDADPFIGIVGALSQLGENEVAVFQVLFEAVRENWNDSIERSVCRADGKPYFINAPELAAAAKWKIMQPLYGAVVRVAVLSESFDRTLAIARDVTGSLCVFADPLGNELIPLDNESYPYETHIADMLSRNSRRTGMLLTSDELVGFVHLPSSAVRSPIFLREGQKTKAAPQIARQAHGILLGHNTHAGETIEVRLSPEARVRHMHILGASGTGKSTLLFNLIRQDIETGQGVALLDPHGDLVDRILGIIPEHRIKDVVLVDPSDEEFSVGFNILSAHSDLEKNLLASDLVGVFQRLSTSWGDQMGSVLRNAILAFLESDRGGTISDLRRFLIEPAYRNEFLGTVRDPDIVYYWRKAFPQLAGNKSIGSVLTRLETFLAPKPIRYMVSQKENRLDFADITDSGKIFLAKLPRGEMGEENSFLLGSFLVAKFQQAAMARQRQEREVRRDFWLYLDEFHNFMTPSMAEILSGTRKYRLGLILAHQELGQLQGDRKVSGAVLSNPFTRVIFRVGDADARNLESGLSFFETKDLQNLEIGQAICRVEKANGDFNLSIIYSGEAESGEKQRREAVTQASRERYGTPRAVVEGSLWTKAPAEWFSKNEAKPKSATKEEKPGSREQKPEPDKNTEIVVPFQTVPPDPIKPPLSSVPATVVDGRSQADVVMGPEREHETLKKRIGRAAEELDYTIIFEAAVAGGNGRADVVLTRGDRAIACEITVTTGAEHEIENLVKCLKGDFGHIALISTSKRKLANIQTACQISLDPALFSKVGFYSPNELISKLREWAVSDAAGGAIERGKPRKQMISLAHDAMTENERKERERAMLNRIAEAMKRKSS